MLEKRSLSDVLSREREKTSGTGVHVTAEREVAESALAGRVGKAG